ncbi:hypothetical protein SAMN04488058_102261 [Deinococcus reticulitermitis]|uniref:TfoX N-terminal domain-containing protein n=1 Tax=Deinococcus reticulitermitis TaxID=856736 RepID=A0A1H6UVH9_9DEIO|nr:hypothetical protein [Deinococcus reticulitermitis]SEI93657.1 hypothetical protein SAMN04488058_102261 [Deinococcus reticulitermitis]
MTHPELQNLRALFTGDPDVQPSMMFGSACLKVRGKVFTAFHAGFMVFKLPPDAHAGALALEGARRWNPSGRRVLREWVAVPEEQHAHFQELALAAARFVGSSLRRKNNV